MQQQVITYNYNMNGRMYDPLLSSFLSPDNYMQDPTSQQGFNRYAYCMYNPLKYIDPTGEQYLGWDSGRQYRMEQEMRGIILNFWHHCYDSALASHFATVAMANCLYGHGPETHGNGRGNHGSGGGDGVKIGSEAFKKLCEKLGIEPGKPIPKDKKSGKSIWYKRIFKGFFAKNSRAVNSKKCPFYHNNALN